MIGAALLDAVLAAFALALAGWTVVTRRSFDAVIGFVALGLLLTLIWVRLGAVDVALAEAAIGAGLGGVLLLGAHARLRDGADTATDAADRPGPGGRVAIGALSALIAAALLAAMLTLPEPAPSLATSAAVSLPGTDLGNAVTGVLLAFRSLDTMLEALVLVLAVIGVWSLARDEAWGHPPTPLQVATPGDGPLTLLARLLPPIGIVVAIHILWAGADDPGGKFQSGTILAAMWILTWMAGLTRPPAIRSRALRAALIAGPVVFLAVGALGAMLAGAFLAYPAGWAKPLIIAIEIAMAISAAVALALLVAGPPQREGGP